MNNQPEYSGNYQYQQYNPNYTENYNQMNYIPPQGGYLSRGDSFEFPTTSVQYQEFESVQNVSPFLPSPSNMYTPTPQYAPSQNNPQYAQNIGPQYVPSQNSPQYVQNIGPQYLPSQNSPQYARNIGPQYVPSQNSPQYVQNIGPQYVPSQNSPQFTQNIDPQYAHNYPNYHRPLSHSSSSHELQLNAIHGNTRFESGPVHRTSSQPGYTPQPVITNFSPSNNPSPPLVNSSTSQIMQSSSQYLNNDANLACNNLTQNEVNALKQQFNQIDKDRSGHIDSQELKSALCMMGFTDMLAELFMKVFDKDTEGLSLANFLNTIATMTKGTDEEKIRVAFKLLDVDNNGSIAKNELFTVIECLYQSLRHLGVNVEQANMHNYVEQLFQLLDINKDTIVTREEFAIAALNNKRFIQGLGLVSVPEHLPQPKVLPKQGIAVSFGSFNWTFVLSIMVGIRRAGDLYTFEPELLTTPDFQSSKTFPALSNSSRTSSFTDYAPMVFRKLRRIFGIDERQYMMSLGPEQLLGNLLLGNLSSLSMKS
eukprot:TRINITY_DN1139_c0_g1_i2.p1 TRINITY_DN1139_c0_g1~~TRINITY_DN1139_c0_g1_i2.p1  ORF type:complete len:536 (-),score=85.68 TRINITY_DN1139_c0_g1_i2:190-1797(-)